MFAMDPLRTCSVVAILPLMTDEAKGDDPRKALIEHLRAFGGGGAVTVQEWTVPHGRAPDGVSIVITEPSEEYTFWTLATVGCWQAEKDCHLRSEFALSANEMRPEHVDLLKLAAFFHLGSACEIALGKVLDIGMPWVDGSACTSLLASLPYPYGPDFESPDVRPCTRFLWLLPITGKEAALVEREGVESLERLFEAEGIAFADPFRPSVVA